MLIQLCFAFRFLYWNNYRCPFHKVLLLFFVAIVFVGEFLSNDTLMSIERVEGWFCVYTVSPFAEESNKLPNAIPIIAPIGPPNDHPIVAPIHFENPITMSAN